MKIIRSIAAVLAGYLVFALGSSAFVYVWFIQRRSAAGVISILLSVICLAAIGLAGGFVTSLIAGRRALLHCGIVAALVGLVTIGNLLMGGGGGTGLVQDARVHRARARAAAAGVSQIARTLACSSVGAACL